MNWSRGLLLALGLTLGLAPSIQAQDAGTIRSDQLPPEARQTLRLIDQGGPFPYPKKDGSVFKNFEKRLPLEPKGYYREYTVPTPGASNRGARRIVTGGNPPRVYYYTPDHYRNFLRIQQDPAAMSQQP